MRQQVEKEIASRPPPPPKKEQHEVNRLHHQVAKRAAARQRAGWNVVQQEIARVIANQAARDAREKEVAEEGRQAALARCKARQGSSKSEQPAGPWRGPLGICPEVAADRLRAPHNC